MVCSSRQAFSPRTAHMHFTVAVGDQWVLNVKQRKTKAAFHFWLASVTFTAAAAVAVRLYQERKNHFSSSVICFFCIYFCLRVVGIGVKNMLRVCAAQRELVFS